MVHSARTGPNQFAIPNWTSAAFSHLMLPSVIRLVSGFFPPAGALRLAADVFRD